MLAEGYNKYMNPRDYIASTDYPMDKVSGYAVGSVAVPASSPAFPLIPHGLPYTPLYFVKWSTDPTFATSYDEIGVSFNFITLSAQTDATNLNLFINNLTGSNVTIYYRAIFFMPTTVSLDANATQPGLDDFYFNTDYNYPKILDQGYFPGGLGTINHNLGYYPQVEAWYIRSSDGKCIHIVDSDVTATVNTPRVVVTQTQVIFQNGTFTSASGWHYKIYLDEL